jgi:thioredoxin 1
VAELVDAADSKSAVLTDVGVQVSPGAPFFLTLQRNHFMAVVNATDRSFAQEVLQAEGLVLVDFWAPWCGPCKMIGPVLEEVAGDQNSAKIVKVNIDENPQTPGQFGVRSVPTLMLFKGGEAIDTKVGALNKQMIQDWLAQAA